MHNAGIAHLDIKPENILMEMYQGEIRFVITDFGISTIVSRESMGVDSFNAIYRRGFTMSYAAPEILSRNTASTKFMTFADIFSLAVVIKVVMCRNVPWPIQQ
jgi:serine/threonine protein kinase